MSPNPQLSIYEINTWVWLASLEETIGRPVDLASVPATAWDTIVGYGFDAVWLMGVWERSPVGKAIAERNPDLLQDFRHCLPDVRPADNVGSAYCIRRYVVDARLGGPEGLATARRELARRGIRLLLDFVPNHVAPDAPSIFENPEHFIQGSAADVAAHPAAYLAIGDKFFACGRDPYFPPWPDVVQVNAFHPGHRARAIQHLSTIAQQCDGVRCDMAMLLLNDIFARTWGDQAGKPPAEEYWPTVIQAVHRQSPEFLFLAEVYWDMEWTLQQQGFAFCYDKRLYDLLVRNDVEGLRGHLSATLVYQEKLIRFIENHDEPRVAALFSPGKAKVAAMVMATLPGARLFHEGQFDGRKSRVPVFLSRQPDEARDPDVAKFYARLLATIHAPVFREGEWALCACSGWPDNPSYQRLGAWCWTAPKDRRLVLINLSDSPIQARVHLRWKDMRGRQWRLTDALSQARYDRDGSEIESQGLYVELPAWGGQVLAVELLS